MRTFTPGPWSVPHFAEPASNCECQYVLCDHLMGAVATVHCSGEGSDWKSHGDNPRFAEAVANAHLIAASPSLYEAALAFEVPGLDLSNPNLPDDTVVLYAVGCDLPELDWGKGEARLDPAVVARMGLSRAKKLGEVGARGGGTDSSPRIGTPEPFRDLLLSIARTAETQRAAA